MGYNVRYAQNGFMTGARELIQDLTYLDPLGKSDHICLTFTIDVVPEISKTLQIKYKMDKGDYEKMRNLFGAINWETELDGKSVEQARTYFYYVYTQVTNECIPKCQIGQARWRRPPVDDECCSKTQGKDILDMEKIQKHRQL
ncbi:hypothetical protein LSH36_1457g00019 [Paralvinella palmiformis]|uniref:Uncharacterized protein n=1 Tax=Paralvinella palmiformis TaxID=53620 RepID=A0AAD9IU68_9ANNE|nr:hypothetical protein LSH36_1457g00019 [Paralvinella palmiformis]